MTSPTPVPDLIITGSLVEGDPCSPEGAQVYGNAEIISPRFFEESGYPPNLDCSWRVHVSAREVILVLLLDLSRVWAE